MFKKEKLLLLCQLPPPFHGSSYMSQMLVNSQKLQAEFHISVIPLYFNKKLNHLGEWSFLKLFKSFYYALQLIFKILTFRPKIVYFTCSIFGFAFYRDVFYMLIIKCFPIKLIVHLHGRGMKKNAQSHRFVRFLAHRIFKNTDFICLSKIMVNDIKTYINREPYIVPNTIPALPIKTHKYKIEKPIKLLYLSNLSREKGLLDLLYACELLLSKGVENFFLQIIGNEYDLKVEEIEEIIGNKLYGKAKYLGPKYGQEKQEYLYESDVFIFPSYYSLEGFSVVILEAMQVGLPIIVSDLEVLSALIKDSKNGLVTPIQNPHVLAEKIELLMKDEVLRERIGKQAQKDFYQYYTFSTFEKSMTQVFHKLLMN